MESTDDLVNKGFIINQPTTADGRTFIVTGLQRSGTTLVASILYQIGIFIGSEINDIVFEDEAMARMLARRDSAALQAMIADRNAQYPRWGFKYPMLNLVLQPEQLALFDRPRLIVTFRDPIAMVVRRSLSEPAAELREGAVFS